ncbi:hypothetical protein [Actinoplanes palleronii]|uniref:Uncharacterized protein n=1 Tax=Actinoplanes palleronii TaxID=113570 RepID=A0ABQ4BN68_9ACTN|nr:hypothetical protein [Actinoplanes palleronii]GIE72093.1 hypothetical protein Apa02nite_082010 [Actinoplanes palleronii]
MSTDPRVERDVVFRTADAGVHPGIGIAYDHFGSDDPPAAVLTVAGQTWLAPPST